MIVLYRRSILRAVAGELPLAREARLRSHLHGCAPCRRLYDELTLVAEAATADVAARTTRTGAAREQGRLLLALDAGPEPARPLPRRRWWPALALSPALAALLWIVWPVRAPAPNVTWRGTTVEPATTPGALIVYGSRRRADGAAGPVRLVAEFPGSGEGRVSLSDFVQFGVRGLRAPAFLTVASVDDDGEPHIYFPRPGSPPQPIAAGRSGLVGSSIDLARGHRPGPLRVYALFSSEPLPETKVRAAVARVGPRRAVAAPLDLPVPQVAGLLIVEP